MLTRQLFIAIICTFTSTLPAQELSFETISLSNVRFLLAEQWGDLPIDTDGEDGNSKKYGLVVPAKEEGSDVLIGQPTLPREQLFIKAQIVNPTNQYWEVQSIELEVLGEYDLSEFEYREGTWASNSVKTLVYMPHFIIGEQLLDHPTNLSIGPSSEFSDNRFWIKVDGFSSALSQDVIYQFRFICTLKVHSEETKATIYSDKNYLLVAG